MSEHIVPSPEQAAQQALKAAGEAVGEAMVKVENAVGEAYVKVEATALEAKQRVVSATRDAKRAVGQAMDSAVDGVKSGYDQTVVKGRSLWHSATVGFLRWFDTTTAQPSLDRPLSNAIDWVRVIPFIGMHVMCLGVFFVDFSWFAVSIALALYVVRMFAITGWYHRYFSHRAFKTSRPMQFLFALIGTASVQRGPLWWAAHHRHHHRHSDEPDDLHSPMQHGFWKAHMGWFMTERGFATDHSRIPDLMKYPELRLLDRYDVFIAIGLAAALFFLGGWLEEAAPSLGTSAAQLLIYGFFVSTVVLFHCTVTINSLSHVWGRRRYQTKDDSRNNWFLAILTFGEGWHNNHHHFPGAVRQGFYWWEYDFTFYALKAMSWFGLVWDLKQVPADLRERGKVADAN